MGRNLAYLIGIIVTILIGIYFYNSCCNCCNGTVDDKDPAQETPIANEPTATSYPFALADGDFLYEVNDNFNFNVSSPSFLLPLSDSVKKGVAALSDHLSTNAERVVNIIGYYKADEENTTAYPNLGIARANSVKNHFVTSGISSAQINTSGQLMDEMIPEEGIYLGPVAYGIEAKDSNADEELQALYDKIKANPLVLYFETGQASINLSAEQRQKVADISRYLDKAVDASCLVIGHTDNTGSRATNIKLGQDRAEFAKNYLMQNGIVESKIEASSEGPDNPIVSNGTEAGRAKNRRVVVTLN
ncbi:OmpA family protein [Allomuricauda sp. d1]|uniref:OmpA family protein n=1 Tax=Allomuricauda sp. d1 TaxID=3136725 RepID=UPI0031DD0703